MVFIKLVPVESKLIKGTGLWKRVPDNRVMGTICYFNVSSAVFMGLCRLYNPTSLESGDKIPLYAVYVSFWP